MSVWFCIPTARPIPEAAAVLAEWKKQGYNVAILTDQRTLEDLRVLDADVAINLPSGEEYPGYARATNLLIHAILETHDNTDVIQPEARWFVIGGDDVHPDKSKPADVIAAECEKHFEEMNPGSPTLGVMQPTGDRWGETPNRGAYIDRVCGSAWLGREFCERAYGGKGPLWHEYFHMFVDEELHGVASMLRLLWQRRDLTQIHDHWMKRTEPDHKTGRRIPPEHIAYVSDQSHWNQAAALHARRKMFGYQGHALGAKAEVCR